MLQPIRILTVNQNRILREGICALIGTQPNLELAGSTAGIDDAVRLFVENRPDLTLMDLDLPARGGVSAISRIIGIDRAAWIIGLVTYEDDPCVVEAMEAGASAVLAKDLLREALVLLSRAENQQETQYVVPAALELCNRKLK